MKWLFEITFLTTVFVGLMFLVLSMTLISGTFFFVVFGVDIGFFCSAFVAWFILDRWIVFLDFIGAF